MRPSSRTCSGARAPRRSRPSRRRCTAGIDAPTLLTGYLSQLAAFHARREFAGSPAGDYLIGFTEMALTSGMRAATEIARVVAG
jgi:monoamine oxidase